MLKKFLFSAVEQHRGEGAEHAHQREQLDLLALDVDADHARDADVVADEQQVLAEAVAVEHEPQQRGERGRPQRLDRHDADAADQDRVDPVVVDRADRVGQAAGQDRRDAAPEELGGERRDDRGDADHRDEQAVDPADQRAAGERQQQREPGQLVGLEGPGEQEARERDHRGEREVDLARRRSPASGRAPGSAAAARSRGTTCRCGSRGTPGGRRS